MIRAAIVGLGRWGRNLVTAAHGGSGRVRFVRGVAPRPETAQAFAAEHGLTVASRLEDVLDDRTIDAVVLATPHSLHVEQVVAAAGAGKSVFCEKPLALTRRDAGRAIDACARAGVALGVGIDKRFWPSMRELTAVLGHGSLGEILHIEGHFSNEVTRRFHSAWREAPGESPAASMTATGIHVLDAFVHLIGAIARVYAVHHLPRHAHPEPLDALAVLTEFESRVSGVLASVRPTPSYWRVHVFGERGSAEALDENTLVLRMTGEAPRVITLDPVNALALEIDAFADAVEGRAPYPASAEEVIATIAALEAIDRSLADGVPAGVSGGPGKAVRPGGEVE